MFSLISTSGHRFRDKSIINRDISRTCEGTIFENDLLPHSFVLCAAQPTGISQEKVRIFFPSLFRLLPTVYLAIAGRPAGQSSSVIKTLTEPGRAILQHDEDLPVPGGHLVQP